MRKVPVDLASLHFGDVEYIVDEFREPIAFGNNDTQVVVDLLDRSFKLLFSGVHAGRMTSRNRRSMIFAKPKMEVSGVRSSWETVEVNSVSFGPNLVHVSNRG